VAGLLAHFDARFEDAIEHFTAIPTGPFRVHARAGIGRAAGSLGRTSLERRSWHTVEASRADISRACARYRLALMDGDRPDETEFSGIGSERGVWMVRGSIASQLVSQGEFESAVEAGATIIENPMALIDPYKLSSLLYTMSIAFRERGRFERATTTAKRSLAMLGDAPGDHRRAMYFNNLDCIMAKRGDERLARATFEIALRAASTPQRKLAVIANVMRFELADVSAYGSHLIARGGTSSLFMKASEGRVVMLSDERPVLSSEIDVQRLLDGLTLEPVVDDAKMWALLIERVYDRFKLGEYRSHFGFKYGTAKVRLSKLCASGVVQMVGERKAATYAPNCRWAL
jgi:hypothetical protein